MTTYAPTPEEFKTHARDGFGFLVEEFGFAETPIPKGYFNPVAVWFVNATTRVVVEGINYGANARVAVGRSGAVEAFDNNDLADLVGVRCPDIEPPSKRGPAKSDDGQLEQLPRLAALLRRCGAEVLRGDFRSFAAIAQRQQRRINEWRREKGGSSSAEHPAAVSPLVPNAMCFSPDGRFRATMTWDADVRERNRAASGTLVITDTVTAAECARVDSCSSSFAWSDDSRALAIPRWTRRANQSLCIISPASRRMKCVRIGASVLELHSLENGMLSGIDVRSNEAKPVNLYVGHLIDLVS